MHYVPESACEFFQEPETGSVGDDTALAAVAPLYLLTATVGLLLAADAALSVWLPPGGEWWRAPWGYRLALYAAVLGGSRLLYHSLENLLAGRFGADLALTIAIAVIMSLLVAVTVLPVTARLWIRDSRLADYHGELWNRITCFVMHRTDTPGKRRLLIPALMILPVTFAWLLFSGSL